MNNSTKRVRSDKEEKTNISLGLLQSTDKKRYAKNDHNSSLFMIESIGSAENEEVPQIDLFGGLSSNENSSSSNSNSSSTTQLKEEQWPEEILM